MKMLDRWVATDFENNRRNKACWKPPCNKAATVAQKNKIKK